MLEEHKGIYDLTFCFYSNLTIMRRNGREFGLGEIAEGAGSPSGRIYSLGNPCPRCPHTTKVKSSQQDLLLSKEVSLSDIRDSHTIYIRREDQHRVLAG